MGAKVKLVVSFLSLLSAWVVGFAIAQLTNWESSLLSLDLNSPLGLFWVGLSVLVLGTMFFGRLGFLAFLALGAIQGSGALPPVFLASFFQALVLCWFGVIGTLVGEQLFEDLNGKRDFDLWNKSNVYLLAMALVLAIVVGLFSGLLLSAGERLVEIASKIRSGELGMQNFFDLFKSDANFRNP